MAVRQFISTARQASAVSGIAQDNIIFAMLLFAFVVWITTKGELATYLAFFKPASGAPGPAPVPVTASSTTGAATSTTNPTNTSNPVTNAVGAINNAVNSTGVGKLISGVTGAVPLSVGTTGGGIIGWVKGLFQ